MAGTVHCIIYRVGPEGGLRRIDAVDVPDTSASPEKAAWSTWSRGRQIPEGEYQVDRAGELFTVAISRNAVATNVGKPV